MIRVLSCRDFLHTIPTPGEVIQREVADPLKQLADKIEDNQHLITQEMWNKFDQDLFRFSSKFPWYAGCFSQMHRVLTFEIPTACVGYRKGDLFFAANPQFLEQLTFLQRCFVYCHEIEHAVRNHPTVVADWPERGKDFNFVMDSLINEALADFDKFDRDMLPKWKSADGKEARMIVMSDIAEINQNPMVPPENKGNAFPAIDEKTFANDYISEQLLKYLPKPGDDMGGVDPVGDLLREMYGDLGEFLDDSSVTDEMKDAITEQMLDEAEKSRGYAPAHLKRYIDAIRDHTNRDWRMLMRGLGSSSRIDIYRSWMKVNRKMPFLKPGRMYKTLPKVLVMVDTSASIGSNEMIEFIKELNGLIRRADIDLAWVDACFDETNEKQFLRNVRRVDQVGAPYGGGGTVFHDFYEFCKRNTKNYMSLLLLTDGYADPPPSQLFPQQILLLTPTHDERFREVAQEYNFKVAIIDESKTGKLEQ